MNHGQPELGLDVQELRWILIECLELDPRNEEIASAERIQDVIAMDSVALLQFVVAIEARYGISLEEEWLEFDRLTDLPALAGYIRQRRAAAGGAAAAGARA